MIAGLKAPVDGGVALDAAFGQLMQNSSKQFYANPGLIYHYASGKAIRAATGGVVKYYAKLAPYGKAIVITAKSGAQTLYARFEKAAVPNGAHVVPGRQIAVSGADPLLFEYAPKGKVVTAGTQSNPCGSGNDGAAATITVMPANVATYVRFHTLTFDGVAFTPGPFPTGTGITGDVGTPETITASNVLQTATASGHVYEGNDVFSEYYVVLCGNAVFQTGNARYTQAYPYPTNQPSAAPSIPPIVFFRDAGAYGRDLTQKLPAPASQACPAPSPPNGYTITSLTFNQIGQEAYVWFWCPSPSTETYTSSNTTVVVASPAAVPLATSPPPAWPPPSPRTDFTATGVGTAQIAATNSNAACTGQFPSGDDATFNVTVNATPSPAPVPTPLPN